MIEREKFKMKHSENGSPVDRSPDDPQGGIEGKGTVLGSGPDEIQLLIREESWIKAREIFQSPRKFDGETTKVLSGSVDSIFTSDLMDLQRADCYMA